MIRLERSRRSFIDLALMPMAGREFKLRNALKDPEFIKRQEALGAVVITDQRLAPAEHKKFVEAEINKWGPAIKAAGQYAD